LAHRGLVVKKPPQFELGRLRCGQNRAYLAAAGVALAVSFSLIRADLPLR
jgi:hypothetical protein